jgi:hypothetical protein
MPQPSFGGIGAEWGIETPPTVRVVAEPRAVLHYSKINETEYTLAPQYGQNVRAQTDAVLSRAKTQVWRLGAVILCARRSSAGQTFG